MAADANSDINNTAFGVEVCFDVVDLVGENDEKGTKSSAAAPTKVVDVLPELSKAMAFTSSWKSARKPNDPRKLRDARGLSRQTPVIFDVDKPNGDTLEESAPTVAGSESTAKSINETLPQRCYVSFGDGASVIKQRGRIVRHGVSTMQHNDTRHRHESNTSSCPSSEKWKSGSHSPRKHFRRERDVSGSLDPSEGCYGDFHSVARPGESTHRATAPQHSYNPSTCNTSGRAPISESFNSRGRSPKRHCGTIDEKRFDPMRNTQTEPAAPYDDCRFNKNDQTKNSRGHSMHARFSQNWPVRRNHSKQSSEPSMDVAGLEHELEALRTVLFSKRQEFDCLSVTLEKRERELEARSGRLESLSIELKKKATLQSEEMRIYREQIERDTKAEKHNLKLEREEFDRLVATKTQQLEVLRIQQEQELLSQTNAVHTQIIEFDAKQASLSRDVAAYQQRFLELNTSTYELNQNISLLASQRTELDLRVLEQKVRESKWKKVKSEFEAASQITEEKQKAISMAHTKQHGKLKCLERALNDAEMGLKQDMTKWKESNARKLSDCEVWVQEIKSKYLTRLSELDAREVAQSKLQKDLDLRSVALRRRQLDAANLKSQANIPANRKDKSKESTKETTISSSTANVSHGVEKNSQKPVFESSFILIDSDSDDGDAQDSKPHANFSQKTNCGIGQQPFRFDYEANYNYNLTEETALEMQERMLRESAAKMRLQAAARVAPVQSSRGPISFTVPVFDVADRYPDHWKWKDPFAVLGLPSNSSMQLVKTQFRRLARQYHPDKSATVNSSAKFHSIATVYHTLTEEF